MKKIFFYQLIVSLIFSNFAFCENPQAPYVRFAYGLQLLDDIDFNGGNGQTFVNGSADFDDGSLWALAAGYRFSEHFGLELEYASRDNDYDSVSLTNQDLLSTGSFTAQSVMINGLGYFPSIGFLRPYLGIGIGALIDGESELDISEFGGTSDLKDAYFAAQFIAGLEAELHDHIRLFAEVRVFTASSPDVENDVTEYNINYDAIDGLLGASILF